MRLHACNDQYGAAFRVFCYENDTLWVSVEDSAKSSMIDVKFNVEDVKKLVEVLSKWAEAQGMSRAHDQ